MTRSVRYMCHTDGPFLVQYRFPTLASMRAYCPKCGGESPRAHRQRRDKMSISVRYEVFERLRDEAKRRGTTMRALVEAATKECK